MYRKKALPNGIIVILLAVVMIVGLIWMMASLFSSPSSKAESMVQQFYDYEQNGDFSESWELFHSKMKEKFPKGHYIQDRAHVFMNHFGVDTFTYKLGEVEELNEWKMAEEDTSFKNVYKIPVTQTYKGVYGNFDLHQEVFVVEEKGELKILWDYNR